MTIEQCKHCGDSGDYVWRAWHGRWPWADAIFFAPFRRVLRFLIREKIIYLAGKDD